jgi:hypothetical protein
MKNPNIRHGEVEERVPKGIAKRMSTFSKEILGESDPDHTLRRQVTVILSIKQEEPIVGTGGKNRA